MLTKNRIISIIASNAKVLLFNIYKQKDQFLKSLMVSFIWGWGGGSGGGAASRSIIYSVYILSYPKKVSNVCVDKKKIVWPPITTCGNERPFLLVKLLSTRGKMETLFYFVCPVKARCFSLQAMLRFYFLIYTNRKTNFLKALWFLLFGGGGGGGRHLDQ